MSGVAGGKYPKVRFLISSGEPIRDSEIASEFFSEVITSFAKQRLPFTLQVSYGSLDVLVEVFRTVAETAKSISENDLGANTIGGIAGGIVSNAMGWFYRHRQNIKRAEVNREWDRWLVIHKAINENLPNWTLIDLHVTADSISIKLKKKGTEEVQEVKHRVIDHDMSVDRETIDKAQNEKLPNLRIKGYCVKCKKMRSIKEPEIVIMKNNKPAIGGWCPVCGTRVNRITTPGMIERYRREGK